MKKSLSGNTWSGSSWDGKSVYTKETKEEYTKGTYTTVKADFRKYASIEDSIADHSAYLNGAMNGSKKRYDGLKGCTDYKKAAQIIKDGGYATSSTYVSKLCALIEQYKLTQYDGVEKTTTTKKTYKVGDVVNFKGGKHYASANAASGYSAKAGKAKITRIYNGKHPYHLVKVSGGTSTVYGWVDANTFE